MGNFNEIIQAHEKLGGGGRHRPTRQMEEFRDVLDECGFQDLGYSGNKFTCVMGMGRGIWCGRDSIEQLVRRNDSLCFWLQKWFI